MLGLLCNGMNLNLLVFQTLNLYYSKPIIDLDLTFGQVKTSSSLWHFYQKLIQIKKSPMHEALTFGKIDFLEDKDEDIFIYRRYDSQNSYFIVINFSEDVKILDKFKNCIEILLDNGQVKSFNNKLQLETYGAVLIKEKI